MANTAQEIRELMAMIEGDDDDMDDLSYVDGEDVDVGAVDLIGAIDLIGARGRGGLTPAQMRRAKQQLLARKLQRGNVDTVRDVGSRTRRLFLGERRTGIVSPALITIVIKAQEDYRPDRVVITAFDQVNFNNIPANQIIVQDLKIGTRSQFSSLAAIGGEIFSPTFFANGADLGLDTIQAGTDLSLLIGVAPATAQAPHTVVVSVVGRALR